MRNYNSNAKLHDVDQDAKTPRELVRFGFCHRVLS